MADNFAGIDIPLVSECFEDDREFTSPQEDRAFTSPQEVASRDQVYLKQKQQQVKKRQKKKKQKQQRGKEEREKSAGVRSWKRSDWKASNIVSFRGGTCFIAS